jgi:hypothetical protein
MASNRTIEDLESSVRIKDIPENFNMDLIIEQLQNAGTMKEIIKGKKEMIVIFENPNFKDVSKMFNDCPVTDDYTMKMEDAMTFDLQEEELTSPKKDKNINKVILTEHNMGYSEASLSRSSTKEAGSPIKFDSATKSSPVKASGNEFYEFNSEKKTEKSEPQQLIKPEPTTRLSEPEPTTRISFPEPKKEQNLRFTDTNVNYTAPVEKTESPKKESPKRNEFKIEDETEPQRKVIEEPKIQTPVKKEEPVREPVREPEQPKKEEPKEEPRIPEPKVVEQKVEEPKREELEREPVREQPRREEREEPKPKREEAPRVEETKPERRSEPKVTLPKKDFIAKAGGSLSEILENTNLPDRQVLGADDPAKQIFDFKYIFITLSIWALWNIISLML